MKLHGYTPLQVRSIERCNICHFLTEIVGIYNGDLICEPCLSESEEDGSEDEE